MLPCASASNSPDTLLGDVRHNLLPTILMREPLDWYLFTLVRTGMRQQYLCACMDKRASHPRTRNPDAHLSPG